MDTDEEPEPDAHEVRQLAVGGGPPVGDQQLEIEGNPPVVGDDNNNNNIYLKSNVHRDTSSMDYITITYNYNN